MRRAFVLFVMAACAPAPPPAVAPPPPAVAPPPPAVAPPPPATAVVVDPPMPAPVPPTREREPEEVARVRFGMLLDIGSYELPDGTRLEIKSGDACEFDPSEPCPIGTTYRVHATKGNRSEERVLKTKSMKILDHTIEVVASGTTTRFRVTSVTR